MEQVGSDVANTTALEAGRKIEDEFARGHVGGRTQRLARVQIIVREAIYKAAGVSDGGKGDDYLQASKAAGDVIAERIGQVEREGWTAEHDDQHADGAMAAAAACYALGWRHIFWPWALKWWKPKSRRRNLVRAGALIIAEIERIDRADPEQRARDMVEQGGRA